MTAADITRRGAGEVFDAVFAADSDPWQLRTRWYEQRKRALTLACLPRRSYARGFEPGCANGELSAALATRCEQLWVSDASTQAVALARSRLALLEHVRVQQAEMPAAWPAPSTQTFDLIVISELGYFLHHADEVARLARLARDSLVDGGTLLSCHWRHPIDGYPLDGDAVHDILGRSHGLQRLGGYLDSDMRIDVWQHGGDSVAAREGIAGRRQADEQRPCGVVLHATAPQSGARRRTSETESVSASKDTA